MADESRLVEGEYNEEALGSIVDKIYPDENKGEVQQSVEPAEQVEETTKEEAVEKPIQENVKTSEADLPPGFGSDTNDTAEDVVEDNEINDEAIDEAIENAPNDNYKQNIVNMRKSLQANKDKVSELQQKLDSLQKNSDEPSDELQKKLEEAYDKLGKFNLMQDPRFVEKYNKPIGIQMQQIKQIVGPLIDQMPEDEKPDPEKLIMQLANTSPVERIKWMRDNISEEYRSAIVPYFTRIDEIVGERNIAIKNHQAELKQMEKDATVKEQQKISEYRTALKAKNVQDVVADGFTIFQKKEGNKEYNEFVDTLHRNVDQIFVSNDDEVQAKAMLLGVAAPIYRNMYEHTQKKLDEAMEEIQNLKGARPKLKGEGSKSGQTSMPKNQDAKSISQMLAKDLDLKR